MLRALAGRYALVGCVSGRPALEARPLVGVEELAYMGNHGYELLAPRAEEAIGTPRSPTRPAAAGLRPGLEAAR